MIAREQLETQMLSGGEVKEATDQVMRNVERVIIGKHDAVRLTLIAVLCRGHVLIEDVPGVGKTVLAKAIARSIGCTFKRIQFTPDLLPSDVTGVSVYSPRSEQFEFRPGPIVSQFVLADEINRATPKTQSALLEAMEEDQITVDGVTYPLPDPFIVLATQNPIEYEGTFPLPEAQLDRFLLNISMGYPSPADEVLILDRQQRSHPIDSLDQVLSDEDLRLLQRQVREITVHPEIRNYIVAARLWHAYAPEHLPRRQPARLLGALPCRAGARHAARRRLRHRRRREGAGQADPLAPPHRRAGGPRPRRHARQRSSTKWSAWFRRRATLPHSTEGTRPCARGKWECSRRWCGCSPSR